LEDKSTILTPFVSLLFREAKGFFDVTYV